VLVPLCEFYDFVIAQAFAKEAQKISLTFVVVTFGLNKLKA
jgi:hypothetical protein